MKKQSTEKRFKEIWFDGVFAYDRDVVGISPYLHCENKMLAFINKETSQARKEGREEILSLADGLTDEEGLDLRKELLFLERLLKELDKPDQLKHKLDKEGV